MDGVLFFAFRFFSVFFLRNNHVNFFVIFPLSLYFEGIFSISHSREPIPKAFRLSFFFGLFDSFLDLKKKILKNTKKS